MLRIIFCGYIIFITASIISEFLVFMKLSIVIPVYNMEKYIVRCLDSIVSQIKAPLKDVEIIVVNDGSQDRSLELIETYPWKEVKHLCINKKNGGLSDARNFGFKFVSGEYVWFVDSDDWIVENSIKRILPLLNGIDVLHFPSYLLQYDDSFKVSCCNSIGTTGRELTQGEYQYPVPFSIYRSEYLRENHLYFQYGIVMEDLHFTPRALYKANAVYIVNYPVYHYYQRLGSIMKSDVSEKRINDRIWISYDLLNFMHNNVLPGDQKKWAECIITDVNAIMFDAFRSHNQCIKDIVKQYINKETYLTELLKHAKNRRNRIWYYLGRLCFDDFYFVYSILYKLRYRN